MKIDKDTRVICQGFTGKQVRWGGGGGGGGGGELGSALEYREGNVTVCAYIEQCKCLI